MAYTKTTWVTGETPLSADNMNNIEDGIEELNSNAIVGPSQGYSTTVAVTSGVYFTAPRSGWMVAFAATDSDQSIVPSLEVDVSGDILIEKRYGAINANSTFAVAVPVKSGQRYKIVCTRCTLNWVRIYY